MQQVSPVLEEDAVFETQILEAKHLIDGVGSRGQGGWVGVWCLKQKGGGRYSE